MSFIFDTIIKYDSDIKVYFFVCLAAAVILGIATALTFMFRNTYTKTFVVTLAVIPSIIMVLIMFVSGNIGIGIGVAGAFSLIKFRSAQGSAKELCYLFLATAIGVACGTGYIGIAFIFTVIMLSFLIILTITKFGEAGDRERALRITIPESLNYTEVFDDLFEKYTDKCELLKVRTTNMGSLFRLQYHLTLKEASKEKEFIDELRIRNGNLDIICARMIADDDSL